MKSKAPLKKARVLMRSQRYDAGKVIKKAKTRNKYLDIVVLTIAQINMFLMAYFYHSSAGFLCLFWLMFSLIFKPVTTRFVSVLVMIPILSWLFVFIYAMRIPGVRDLPLFRTTGKYFEVKLANDSLEQFLMIVTLLLFYSMISSYIKNIDSTNVENFMMAFFRKRVRNKKYLWMVVFLASRYVQVPALLFFFWRGIGRLNAVNNLGFLFFFVLYSAYQKVYRHTGFLLVIFISIFILGQYFMSLYYQIYMHDEIRIRNLYWWNIFPNHYKIDSDL